MKMHFGMLGSNTRPTVKLVYVPLSFIFATSITHVWEMTMGRYVYISCLGCETEDRRIFDRYEQVCEERNDREWAVRDVRAGCCIGTGTGF